MESLTFSALTTFLEVLLIDLVMAADNAIAVGMAIFRLPPKLRQKSLIFGMAMAMVFRILFAFIAAQLLEVRGLSLMGGLLLLWVAWNLWQDFKKQPEPEILSSLQAQPKSLSSAIFQIVIADISMSLDNVLAVAGAARTHMLVMAFGLVASVALMGAASHAIAAQLNKHRWLGYLGISVIFYVAFQMIYEGAMLIL